MRRLSTFPRWGLAVALTVTVSAVGTFAFANHEPGHVIKKGKGPSKTVVVTDSQPFLIGSEDWTNLPGAKAKIKVPDGKRALLLARFTAETVCYAPPAPEECSARIMVDGKQALPASGKDFHIDSSYAGEDEESQKAHAFDRSLEVGAGTHVVKVQGAAMGSVILRLDDWSLTVERVNL